MIAAAVAVLKEAGEPLKVSEIFARAEEKGLLPATSCNTIRGRFTAHSRISKPLITALPRRAGWELTAAGRDGSHIAHRRATHLRDRAIEAAWLRRKRSPESLVRLVEGAPGAYLSVRSILLRPLDVASLSWFVNALPFAAVLRARLLNAKGIQGRTSVLNVEERRETRPRRRRRQAVA